MFNKSLLQYLQEKFFLPIRQLDLNFDACLGVKYCLLCAGPLQKWLKMS